MLVIREGNNEAIIYNRNYFNRRSIHFLKIFQDSIPKINEPITNIFVLVVFVISAVIYGVSRIRKNRFFTVCNATSKITEENPHAIGRELQRWLQEINGYGMAREG